MGKNKMNQMVDWNKNNKIALRNPSNSSFHMHELIKQFVVLFLREKYKDSHANVIETERKVGDRIADIWLRTRRGDIYVWEVQENLSKRWLEDALKDYEQVNFEPIPLKKVIETWEDRISNNLVYNKKINLIDDLRIVLSEYLH